MNDVEVWHGDCRELMARIPDGSIDAIICDPPYPCISREYGRMTEVDWHAMMRVVVAESRRVLRPTGSAVFVLQPNSERVGRMRAWLWEFMAWTAREWNQVRDMWWWNTAALPMGGCERKYGLCRPSLRACVWLGESDCHRDQEAVLWTESAVNKAQRLSDRFDNSIKRFPSTQLRRKQITGLAEIRGGTTPFNVLPIGNARGPDSAGAHGHGAGTPIQLADWWVRYITRDDDTVLDPFAGSGTIPLAAFRRHRRTIAIEKEAKYVDIIRRRLDAAREKTALFDPIA